MTTLISESALDELARKFRGKLEAQGFSYEQLLNYAAYISATNEISKSVLLNHAKIDMGNQLNDEIKTAFEQALDLSLRHSEEAFDEGWNARKTHVGRKGADALHNQKNGYRERGDKVRELWANGQYITHTQCAEDASKKFNLAFSTAYRHLGNAPNPDPWPARDRVLEASK